jgi:hypothetical protein
MGSEARLFQVKPGDWWLHDPDIGLLARIVPMEMALRALQSQSGERALLYALYRAGVYTTPPTERPSETSGGPRLPC